MIQTLLAVGQAGCMAEALSGAFAGAVPTWALAGFAVLALARAAIAVQSERVASGTGAAARRRLRSDALGRLIAAGPAALRGRHSGAMVATVVDRVEALDGFFARWLPAATLALAAPGLVAVAVLFADWPAALILLACGALVPLAMAFAGIGAAAASRRQFQALSRLQARFLDRVRGIATIVMAGRGEDEALALKAAADELRRRTMRVLRVAFLSSVALDCAAAAALVILALRALASGPPASASGFTGGFTGGVTATALFTLLCVPEFFAPLRAFSAAYQDRIAAQSAAAALGELPDWPEPAPPLEIRTVAARGVTVAFDNVRLTWDEARGPALDGLSFRVPAGETLILAGPSGSGKTTAIEILLGFVRPEAGRVTVNGADIADLTAPALARLSAWVGQKPVLFAGTVRDNIRFARPEASDAEVEDAARAARIAADPATLPAGLDTPIGEAGHGISGGQAQRVAIARAFLKNAPLLLLDEPTAHLDPATEAEVLDSLRRLALGRTVILASHSAAAHAFGGRRVDIRDGRAAMPARVSA
jgi:ATP-binding cassette subfamily C protein CydD